MFFKKKAKKLDLLYVDNIKVGCKEDTKENVIRQVGQMLVDTGYVDQSYVDGMIKREDTVSTYMGNELALPHGVEEAKKAVKASGIAIMIFPEGTDWGGERAKVVVGIAGVGDEHVDILAMLAEHVLEEGSIEKMASASREEIFKMLS